MNGQTLNRDGGGRLPRILIAGFLAALVAGCTIGSTTAPPAPPRTGQSPATGRSVDPQVAERLRRLMVPVIQVMDNPIPLNQVQVGIIDDREINAASAGGGRFYVTLGLLERASDQQLLGVLAHEVAHDDLGHVARAQALGLGLNLATVLLEGVIPGSGRFTPIAGELVARAYSRNEEYAADRHAVELLRRINQPKDVLVDTLKWLVQVSGPGRGGFFSTHPATGDRIAALERM